MELGTGGLAWFPFVPAFCGNRKLSEGDQLRLELKRITGAEMLGLMRDEDLYLWRNAALADHLEFGPGGDLAPEQKTVLGQSIASFDIATLRTIRRFTTNTQNFENFIFDGRLVTSPAEIFLLCDGAQCPGTGASLIEEIVAAIGQATLLRGDALKNFVSACAGTTMATPLEEKAGSTAAGAPETTSMTLPAG